MQSINQATSSGAKPIRKIGAAKETWEFFIEKNNKYSVGDQGNLQADTPSEAVAKACLSVRKLTTSWMH